MALFFILDLLEKMPTAKRQQKILPCLCKTDSFFPHTQKNLRSSPEARFDYCPVFIRSISSFTEGIPFRYNGSVANR